MRNAVDWTVVGPAVAHISTSAEAKPDPFGPAGFGGSSISCTVTVWPETVV